MIRQRIFVAFLIGLLLPQAVFLQSQPAAAQTEIERLQQQINDRNDRLSQIEAEIAKFEAELQEVGAERESLQAAINRLESERKKVSAEIARTENQIASTDLEINKLSLEISRTESDIETTQEAIASIIRSEFKNDDETLVELLLNHNKLSDFWSTLQAHESFVTACLKK